MLKPKFAILSTRPLLRVLACNINPIYNGTGVSWAVLCLTIVDVFGVRWCLTQLNFSNWEIVMAAGDITFSIWSLILGPSNIIFTSVSNKGGIESS